MNNGIKIMILGVLSVVVAIYLDAAGIVEHDHEVFLVVIGVLLGLVGFFKKT